MIIQYKLCFRDALERLCRICGRQVVTKAMKVKHLCAVSKNSFWKCSRLPLSDSPNMHPQFFCNSCKTVLFKASNAVSTGLWYSKDGTTMYCQVCEHYCSFLQRGRPK